MKKKLFGIFGVVALASGLACSKSAPKLYTGMCDNGLQFMNAEATIHHGELSLKFASGAEVRVVGANCTLILQKEKIANAGE